MATYNDVRMMQDSMQSLTDTLLKKRMMEQQEREFKGRQTNAEREIERQLERDRQEAGWRKEANTNTAAYRAEQNKLREREVTAKEAEANRTKGAKITEKWTTNGSDIMEVTGDVNQISEAKAMFRQQTGVEPKPYVPKEKEPEEKRPVTVGYTDENGLQVNLHLTEEQAKEMIPGINNPKGTAKPKDEPMGTIGGDLPSGEKYSLPASQAMIQFKAQEEPAFQKALKELDAQFGLVRQRASAGDKAAQNELKVMVSKRAGLIKDFETKKAALQGGAAKPGPAAAPTGGKPLDAATAKKFLDQSGGDKNKAREAAAKAGYTF